MWSNTNVLELILFVEYVSKEIKKGYQKKPDSL